MKKNKNIPLKSYIKKIMENYYSGYNVKKINQNSITLTKSTNYKYEIVEIYDDEYPFINHIICEQRANGIIVTKIEQKFDETFYSKCEKQMVHLLEKRFVFTNTKLIKLFKGINNLSLEDLCQKILTIPITIAADMYTYFSTSMQHVIKDENNNEQKSHIIPTRTYLNGEDISSIYDSINGHNKLSRIYNLYIGVINEENRNDIKDIYFGILNPDAFGLKELKGITCKEDHLVGESLELLNQENRNCVKEFSLQKTGFVRNIKYNREFVLNYIMHAIVSNRSAKRGNTQQIGISNEEYETTGLGSSDKRLIYSRRYR